MPASRSRLTALLAGAALLAGLATAPAVHAASTLYVGLGGGPGGCASPAYTTIAGAVAAAVDGDTIHICAGQYALDATVAVAVDLSFVGDGASTTVIDGGSSVRLFDGTDRTLSFSGLTLQNGYGHDRDGGAVSARTVTVDGTAFIGNSADSATAGTWVGGGAIFATDSVVVTDSTFSGNAATALTAGATGAGGAIATAGAVTVSRSTFSANTVSVSGYLAWGLGGAIDAWGSAHVSNSTFSGNSVVVDGLSAGAWGGAIHARGVDSMNSTFSGNSTSAAGEGSQSGGGAIYAMNGSVGNTIIAGGLASCLQLSPWADAGGNFTTDITCLGAVVAQSALALGALADNGGPTQTMALGATSIARDAGEDGTCAAPPVSAVDQRGVIRPAGVHCDSGAFELSPPSIDSFTPTQGLVGTVLTITGAGFVGVRSIEFVHALASTWTVVDPRTIAVTVPDAALTGPISVTTADGTAMSATDFTIIRYPRITSFTPSQGPIGTVVTISGLFFTGATTAKIGGKPLADFRLVDDFTMTGTIAPGTSTGKVSVTTPGGTYTTAQSFTVTLGPVVTGFSPPAGKAGTTVTISGTGFGYAHSVTIGGKAAVFSVRSPSTIVATVPAGAATGKIVVASAYGSATSALSFVVLP